MAERKKRRFKEDSNESGIVKDKGFDKEAWKPKTELGKKVKNEIADTLEEAKAPVIGMEQSFAAKVEGFQKIYGELKRDEILFVD